MFLSAGIDVISFPTAMRVFTRFPLQKIKFLKVVSLPPDELCKEMSAFLDEPDPDRAEECHPADSYSTRY